MEMAMTDAPELIWLASPETAEEYGEPITSPNRHPMAPPVKEYIRKDLSDAAIAELVEGLRKVVREYDADDNGRTLRWSVDSLRALIAKYGDKT
jgi:hypothetical protein